MSITFGGAVTPASAGPTEPYAATLSDGSTTTGTDLLSLAVVNDDTSTGNVTVTSGGSSTYLKPGESIGWDAAAGSTLTAVTITVPLTAVCRLFGTRAAGV